MKYVEELEHGDCFTLNNFTYVKSLDFKKNGDSYCVDLQNGKPKWINAQTIVELTPIYKLDKENNVVPIKETKNISTQ